MLWSQRYGYLMIILLELLVDERWICFNCHQALGARLSRELDLI